MTDPMPYRAMLTDAGEIDPGKVWDHAHERALREFRLMKRLDGAYPPEGQRMMIAVHFLLESFGWARAMRDAVKAGNFQHRPL